MNESMLHSQFREQIIPFEEGGGREDKTDLSHFLGPAHDGYGGHDQWELNQTRGLHPALHPWVSLRGSRGHTLAAARPWIPPTSI